MNFQEAARKLSESGVTNQEMAQACGVSRNTIERARMSGSNSRPPPPNWKEAFRELAMNRSVELDRLADLLETA